jgi:hypothetical protein
VNSDKTVVGGRHITYKQEGTVLNKEDMFFLYSGRVTKVGNRFEA